jgi:hypothetical protein
MKIENQKNFRTVLGWHFSPRHGSVGLAQWHSGPAGPSQPVLRALSVVTAWRRGGAVGVASPVA